MKKIILFLFVGFLIVGNVSFVWNVNAQSQSDCALSDPVSQALCDGWKAVMNARCNDAWWSSHWEWSDCKCTMFPGTEIETINSCDSVSTQEELLLMANDCEWWKILKNWNCCPEWNTAHNNSNDNQPKDCCDGTPYNKDDGYSVSPGDADKCCEWEVYQKQNEKYDCCGFGSAVIKSGGVSECKSCSSLSTEELADSSVASACAEDDTTTASSVSDVPLGMTINEECLLNGQCKFNVYDALGIRQSVRNEWDATSVGLFVQDIVLAVTMFIGTVVTVAIMVSWLMWIFAWATGKDPTKAKSWLINALIGLLIVTCSYLIIRVVQYIAKGI